jgi:hypothetical protein
VAISPETHLLYQTIVPDGKSTHAISPAHSLRVTGITRLMVYDDGEDGVHLPVLAQQAFTIQVSRVDVPDSHALTCGPDRQARGTGLSRTIPYPASGV